MKDFNNGFFEVDFIETFVPNITYLVQYKLQMYFILCKFVLPSFTSFVVPLKYVFRSVC